MKQKYLFIPIILLPFLTMVCGAQNYTDEKELKQKNGVVYTIKNNPFTGTSLFEGNVGANERDNRQPGKRITQYKNGLKNGTQRIYHIYPIPYRTGKYHTSLKTEQQYKDGLLHGLKIENHRGEDCRESETPYDNGIKHGTHKEYYWIKENCDDSETTAKKIGPLKLEIEYNKGQPSGIYRTWSQSGRIDEEYTQKNGIIISGRKKIAIKGYRKDPNRTSWEFYEDGQLIHKETYLFCFGEMTDRPYKEIYPIESESFYDNGILTEERIYNYKNQKVKIHRKRINGELIELFNRDKKINRLNNISK